ncbi:putative proteinral secretion pathway protein J/W [Pseudomonas syringae pv. cilantro]|uniref:Type II secretion system protein J n=2 Tax=Pseudomonas syringae group TaxID=136849 RepID=A0A0N0GGN3_PSESX|nr:MULTISPECIES: type II secretion system protein GspJ [Pseudomonas syringae group]KPC33679.1 putative proteinral secretion pathway protein J/W [Pseudomonas syringae pv. cilantro]KPW72434.1 putative proteinral secretion pathway protein J/W [Pseudomonas syringae pv. coriandricola]RMN12585.1 putative proteinral secretion pathway protein J/W [Pseudomonas syringae pv. coriandricola]
MNRAPKPAHQHGFTLLEVMVAILLMTLVSLIAWRGLDSVTRTDRHLRDDTEKTESLLRALNQMERDVLLRASVELREPVIGEDASLKPETPAALSVRSADKRHFRLDVIRSAATPEDGLQRVRWWLDNKTLYRAAAIASDRYPLPAPGDGIAVLDGIVDVRLRVWKDGRGWQSPDSHKEDNPQGLEVILTRQTDQGEERYRKVLGPLE